MILLSIIVSLIWTGACGVLAFRKLPTRGQGPLHLDQFFLVMAIAQLALAPWISLVVYRLGDGQTVLGGVVNLAVAAVLFLAAHRQRRHRMAGPVEDSSSASYRQKSAALTALTLVLVYGVYFVMTWQNPVLTVPLFLGSVLLVVILLTIGHVVLALFHLPAEELDDAADERDREAARYSGRNAYLVLAWGIWVVPVVSILQMPNVLVMANVAFVFIVLAEIVKYGSLVFFYRHGAA